MMKLTCSICMSFNESIFFINLFYIFFFIYIKMSKDSSAKCYQNDKEILQIKGHYSCEWYKNLPEEGKQNLVEYRRKCIKKWEKTPYNYKKLFFI